MYIRSIGWLGTLLATDAFLYYHTNEAYRYAPKRDLWNNLWDFSGNGDGTLTYPGKPGMFGMTRHQPVASLRLKLLRQSSYDAQYVAWMEKKAKKPIWWESGKEKLVKDFLHWSRDYWVFKEMRDKMAKHIADKE